MTRITLPAARAPLVAAGGLTSPQFYRWMQSVDRTTNAGSDASAEALADIALIAKALGAPDGDVNNIPAQGKQAAINGNGSIVVDGTLSSGAVNITLAYDTQFPDPTAYYGSGPDGKRGWFPVSGALADSVTIHVDTNADTGVSSFDLVGFGALTSDDLSEGSTHQYFTKARVASSLVQGDGIELDVDGEGNTTISLAVADGGVLLADWAGVQLTDWSDEELEDWTPVAANVITVFGRTGTVVALAGDYDTSKVTENSGFLYFTAARVRATTLTGLSTGTATAITAADSLLAALAKLQAQISAEQVVGQPVKAPIYTLATLPAASATTATLAAHVFCSDMVEGLGPVWSDGTNWRRFTDNTVAN